MGLGLLATAFTLGVRHGFDWDHIAAIGDLSGTAETRRRGFVLAMLYAVGHAIVVFALGTAAIVFGLAIPEGFDVWMGRVVGITLIALGAWILIELVRKGRDFRLQSRWMLMISGTFAGLRKVRNAATGRTIEVEHDHTHEHVPELEHDDEASRAHDHAHVEAEHRATQVADSTLVPAGSRARNWFGRGHAHGGHSHSRSSHRDSPHSHGHTHQLALPDTAEARYGNGTATGIGMLHGVGIESPTQIAIFVASTAAVGVEYGLVLLSAWVVGLLIANAVIALLVGAGLLQAEKRFAIYATLAVIVGVMSIALGMLYILGIEILPDILT